jgi:hypothetical protein
VVGILVRVLVLALMVAVFLVDVAYERRQLERRRPSRSRSAVDATSRPQEEPRDANIA